MSEKGNWLWHELLTEDTDRAAGFYKEIFGWETRSMEVGEMGTYHLWQHRGADHGGMTKIEGTPFEGAAPHWLIYIGVDDVDGTAEKIPRLGGAVIAEPYDVPGVGRMAICRDPGGAAFVIMKPAEG